MEYDQIKVWYEGIDIEKIPDQEYDDVIRRNMVENYPKGPIRRTVFFMIYGQTSIVA